MHAQIRWHVRHSTRAQDVHANLAATAQAPPDPAHLLQHGQRHVIDDAGVRAHELQPLGRADDAVARGVRLRKRLRAAPQL